MFCVGFVGTCRLCEDMYEKQLAPLSLCRKWTDGDDDLLISDVVSCVSFAVVTGIL